eukprot:6470759-Amphidinium_carterae.2
MLTAQVMELRRVSVKGRKYGSMDVQDTSQPSHRSIMPRKEVGQNLHSGAIQAQHGCGRGLADASRAFSQCEQSTQVLRREVATSATRECIANGPTEVAYPACSRGLDEVKTLNNDDMSSFLEVLSVCHTAVAAEGCHILRTDRFIGVAYQPQAYSNTMPFSAIPGLPMMQCLLH